MAVGTIDYFTLAICYHDFGTISYRVVSPGVRQPATVIGVTTEPGVLRREKSLAPCFAMFSPRQAALIMVLQLRYCSVPKTLEVGNGNTVHV